MQKKYEPILPKLHILMWRGRLSPLRCLSTGKHESPSPKHQHSVFDVKRPPPQKKSNNKIDLYFKYIYITNMLYRTSEIKKSLFLDTHICLSTCASPTPTKRQKKSKTEQKSSSPSFRSKINEKRKTENSTDQKSLCFSWVVGVSNAV